ncbi:MAG: hypothetical protein PSV23_04725 [Brevundimonas sp.]|uniref:hypothetical protein n=1 Tax=Brevundimonas sp. TaxID=1871086 RepID=UPI002486EC34|nr:hypothetical protein [Brevundimonas sp.]MDI1326087.1 hypothetical protein [Brevundimonas sp.]
MTGFNDEILMRRIDGELDAATAAAVDAAARTHARVAERLASLRMTTVAMRDAFPVMVDPRDAALAQCIARAPITRGKFGLCGWPEWLRPQTIAAGAALAAAGFAAGVMVAPGIMNRPAGLVDAQGRIADVALVEVLDARLNADGQDTSGLSVGLTFKDHEARWCRTFQDAAKALAGLACRKNEAWMIEALVPSHSAVGELRMAGSDMPTPVLVAVDDLMGEDTATATEELQARDAGFR